MQTHIVGQHVERAVVRKSLWHRRQRRYALRVGRLLLENVVLGDEVPCTWMQGSREEGAHDEIPQCVRAGVLHEEIIKGHLGNDVENMYSCHGEVVDHHGTDGIEDDLERGEEGLSKDGIEEEGFESGGKISVKSIYSKRLVMRQMIWSKGSAVGQPDGKICKDGQQSICKRRSKSQIVGDFVDGEEEVLICSGSDHICNDKEGG